MNVWLSNPTFISNLGFIYVGVASGKLAIKTQVSKERKQNRFSDLFALPSVSASVRDVRCIGPCVSPCVGRSSAWPSETLNDTDAPLTLVRRSAVQRRPTRRQNHALCHFSQAQFCRRGKIVTSRRCPDRREGFSNSASSALARRFPWQPPVGLPDRRPSVQFCTIKLDFDH